MSELMRLARAAANRQTTGEIAPTQGMNTTATFPPGACATCAHYRAAPDDSSGRCARYRAETWGHLADGCANDWKPADPVAQELNRRHAGLVARLKAEPSLRYAFDVADASLRGRADRDVRVLLGLRDSGGHIFTGEITIPAGRWPGIVIFNEHWRQATEGRPS